MLKMPTSDHGRDILRGETVRNLDTNFSGRDHRIPVSSMSGWLSRRRFSENDTLSLGCDV